MINNILFSCKTPKRQYHFFLMPLCCVHAQMCTCIYINVNLPFHINAFRYTWFIYKSFLRANTLELYEKIKFYT